MAKIRQRRLFVEPPAATDLVGYDWYFTDAESDSAQFLTDCDNGNPPNPPVRTTGPEYFPDQPEGNYQYCVIAVDDAANESDPFQAEEWRNVPLDVTPPDAPTAGGIEFVAP